MKRTFVAAAMGLLLSATMTFAQDDIAKINGEFDQSQNSMSDLQSSFNGASDVQRDAIIQSLQTIITQLQSNQGSGMSVPTGISNQMQQSYPTGGVAMAQSYAQPYSGPMTAPMNYSTAPVMQAPVMQAPVMQAPMMQAPVMQAPMVQAPVMQAPMMQAPIAAPAPMQAAPMPQPQSYVEYGPVFQMPQPQQTFTVMVPVFVPVQQQAKRHGCRLFNH